MIRVILLFLTISSTSLGQDADTLLLHYLRLENDTEKVNLLYQQGYAIRNTEPSLAYQYASYAEKIATKINAPKFIAKSYNLLGILYYKRGELSTAITYHQNALKIRIELNDLLGIAHSQNNLGNIYIDLQLYKEAEHAYLSAIEAYQLVGNTDKIRDCLSNLGILLHHQKKYQAALENYKLALKLCDQNDYNSIAIYTNNMAEAYLNLKDTSKAIALNEDALKLRLMTENYFEAGDSYINLASIYCFQNDLKKCNTFLFKADSIANAYNYFELKQHVRKVTAFYLHANRNYEKAFQLLETYYTSRDSGIANDKINVQNYFLLDNEKDLKMDKHLVAITNKNLIVLLSILSLLVIVLVYKNKR